MNSTDPARRLFACRHKDKYVEVVAGLPDHAAMVAAGRWNMASKDRWLIEVTELWRFSNGKEIKPA